MSFDSGRSKQVQKVIFSKKMKSFHPSVYFNNILVISTLVHKDFGMLLDDKSSYQHHLKLAHVLDKVKITIALLRQFQQNLPRQSLNHNLQSNPSTIFRLLLIE